MTWNERCTFLGLVPKTATKWQVSSLTEVSSQHRGLEEWIEKFTVLGLDPETATKWQVASLTTEFLRQR